MIQNRTSRGFTLIELLVVIAIIAILAAILFPVFAQARTKARQAADMSNLKQMGTAMLMYSQDYDESMVPWHIPGTPGDGCSTGLIYWPALVQSYVKNTQVFISPQYEFEYDLNDAGGTPWVCRERNINIRDNRFMRVSYMMNNIEPNVWDGTPWKDDPINHWGIRLSYPGGSLTPTYQAEIILPSNTIWVVNGHSYGESWGARFSDFLLSHGLWDSTATGKEWTGGKPSIHGVFQDRINILYTDGHVATKQWGSTLPSDWSIQDDRAQDPWAK